MGAPAIALLLVLALALLAVAGGIARYLHARRRLPPHQAPLELLEEPKRETLRPGSTPESGVARTTRPSVPPVEPSAEPATDEPATDEPATWAESYLRFERPRDGPAEAPGLLPAPTLLEPEPERQKIVVPIVLDRPAPRPPRRRAPPPWYPIVLVHGVLGFDALPIGAFKPAYFRGVADRLRHAGSEVHVVRVSPVAGIAVRAAQLAAQVRAISSERVNLIAHSMGGLDARYAISHLGLADRVASLTTVGTPHRGTPIADSGVWLLHEQLKLRGLLELLGIDAFSQLTTEHLDAFNGAVPDASGVYYASCPARVTRGLRGVNSLLAAGYLVLERVTGDNDGVVPTESQRWGDVLDEIEADHWAQVGWSTGFDAVSFYDQLVRALRRRRL